MNEVHALLRPFLQICLLRTGPQELPSSTFLLALTVVAHTLMSILLSTVRLDVGTSLLAGATDTVLLCGLTAGALWAMRMPGRVVQTLTAMTGAGTVLAVIALPVMTWLHAAQAQDRPAPLATLGILALIAWSVAVSGHILRHALSAPFFVGLITAVVFYWISIAVLNAMFPLGN